jgi:hypothetical protein
MFDLEGILKIPHMATLLSLILGFGIAAMFRPLCKGTECMITRGPPVTDIKGSVYQFGNKCVEFTPKPIECPAKSSSVRVLETVEFASS